VSVAPLEAVSSLSSEQIVFTAKVDGDPVSVSFASQAKGEAEKVEEIAIPPKEIFIMRPDGQNLRRLTRYSDNITSATICPRGERIVFSKDWPNHSEIFMVDVDGMRHGQLTENNGNNSAPR